MGISQPKRSSIDIVADAIGAEDLDFAGMSSPDGAVTLLLTDIENLAELRDELGEARALEIVHDHANLVEKLVQSHFGQVVRSEGDGYMCSFQSCHSALHCAIQIQRTFGEGPGPAARVGVHAGFITAGSDKPMGRNVVLAARIAGEARGREILASAAVKDYVASDPSFEFEPRGERHFKGLLGEHKLFALPWTE